MGSPTLFPFYLKRITFVEKHFSVFHPNNLKCIFLQHIHLIFGLIRHSRMLSLTVELRAINKLCDNRFLAWESTFTELSFCWESTRYVTGSYLQRRQQHSELRSNYIVLMEEHNKCGIVVSAVPPPGPCKIIFFLMQSRPRGQLRINVTRTFKVFTIWKTLKTIQVKLVLNWPIALKDVRAKIF